VPTPIQHLTVAERILAAPVLPAAVHACVDWNEAVRGAFFFGHIAPDVQVVSRQPRETTHFFTLPPRNSRPAYTNMLAAHPRFAQPATLAAPHAAFLAGYLSHLLLDECWVRQVFYPVFGPGKKWGDRQERFLLHNVLRAWLDRRDFPRLPDGIADLLGHAEPKGWLPFATDADLIRWRDIVADQLAPGAALRTVEIFANRARIPDAKFLALVEPDAMTERIFSRVSLGALDRLHDRAVVGTVDLIVRYLYGCAPVDSG
jgi:hypothetical protein